MTLWRRRLLCAVPIAWVAAAHLGPVLATLRISLVDIYPGPPGRSGSFSLAAYTAVWTAGGYGTALLRSLALAAVATVIALLLAFPLAYHAAVRVPPGRRTRRILLLVAPFWAGDVIRMFALVLLLANRGALNAGLHWLGLTEAPVRLLYGPNAVIAGLVYTVLPAMLLPLYATLDRLPHDMLEAASDLGAGAWVRFWTVTLPLAFRGVAAAMAMTFLAALGVLAAPALLGGAQGPVLATVIADAFGAASGRWPLGAAAGLILLLAGSACAVAMVAPARGRTRA